jgi:four helix bundle protein
VICRTGIAFFAASSRPIDGNSFDVWHSQAGITRVLNGISFAPVVLMTRPELEARSMAFAVAVKELCDELRVQPIAWNTASQLLDASTSMAANYRATARSRSRAEWIAKLGGVVEESDEAVHWLEFIVASRWHSLSALKLYLWKRKSCEQSLRPQPPRRVATHGAAEKINR